MSGGAFEYKQYKIEELIEDMKLLLERVDKEPIDSFECDSLKNYIDDKDSFKKIVEKNINLLRKSYIYTQRLDWFISGDDGEETFYERLEEDFNKNNMKFKNPKENLLTECNKQFIACKKIGNIIINIEKEVQNFINDKTCYLNNFIDKLIKLNNENKNNNLLFFECFLLYLNIKDSAKIYKVLNKNKNWTKNGLKEIFKELLEKKLLNKEIILKKDKFSKWLEK